jgi:asparagine synthase (glutamine-hydrolysing)
MCGIAAIFSKQQPTQVEITSITDAISHRGPDAQGYFIHNQVALGHRRLSIIDLDARANQPFFSQNGRYALVFNGEIYNFKEIAQELTQAGITLQTSSDTEVLLEAFILWGTGFVHKLKGMFAFVIYDKQVNQLYLYRDRVGKKPLYYYQSDSLFVFASEIKSILKHPVVKNNIRINRPTLSSFLQLGYIQQPKTFYLGIYKFPAGHYGVLKPNFELSILPYWNVAHYIKTKRPITEAQAFVQLKDLVTGAVTARLVADVPLGIFLSGGIDSSLVTAIAAQSKKIETFSIGFKDSRFDESEHAERIAEHLKTEHHRYILAEQDAVNLVEQYVEHFDEPFADTSAIPTMLVSQLARKKVTVALTGDGGDELFLGYGSYTWANRLTSPLWSTFRPAVHLMMKSVPSTRWKRAARLFEKVQTGKLRRHIFSQEQYFFSDPELQSDLLANKDYYTDWYYDDFRNLKTLSEAERQALFDFQFYLRDDLLVKVDRASMYYGLECRCPLLDHELVEFVINLPEPLRKQNQETKYLLKKMLFEYVPARYFDRPKWGFSVPLAQWLKTDLNYLMNYLSVEQLERTAVFNVSYVRNLVDRFFKGEDYLYNRLWVIIIAQRFLLRHA